MKKLILALILAIAVCPTSWAQFLPAPVFPSQTTDQTAEEVQQLTGELTKQAIPDKESLLLRELDRIDGEIAKATQQLQKANGLKSLAINLTPITDRLATQAKALAQFDCQNNALRIQQALQPFFRTNAELSNYLTINGLGGVDVFSLALPPAPMRLETAEGCNFVKAHFSSSEYLQTQTGVLGGVQKAATDRVAAATNLANAETGYLDALKKRRASLQDKLNASQPAFQIGSNLWLLLLILGGACVLTILGIKLFEPELQMEWVASGQVIQFVTVMILLSVILALGLSTRLQENTLGTLLGGIAGYVLAQGVGRSVARDVARAQSGPPAAVPPPPGPPPGPAAAPNNPVS